MNNIGNIGCVCWHIACKVVRQKLTDLSLNFLRESAKL